jgi:hypothetical protein
MGLIDKAADRLLGAIVPRATAVAFSCPPGTERYTYGCLEDTSPSHFGWYWYDCCKVVATGQHVGFCGFTSWQC